FSSAAPYITAAALLAGSELVVQGVNVNPLRTGLLGVLERMGGRVAVFNRRTVGGEPVADLEVRATPLVATKVAREEVPRLVDEHADGFAVRGTPSRPRGGSVDAQGDHRIAMLAAIAGLVSREGVRIEGADSAAISFPGFFDLLDSVSQR